MYKYAALCYRFHLYNRDSNKISGFKVHTMLREMLWINQRVLKSLAVLSSIQPTAALQIEILLVPDTLFRQQGPAQLLNTLDV